MSRDTVGKIATDLLKGSKQLDHSADEQMREQLTDYDKNIFETVARGKNTYTDDFYVVVETKKEPKMHNVIRNYFFHRKTCPTPTYDNAVYKYHAQDDHIEFLWVLPSRDVCTMMKEYALQLPTTQKELLQFVLDDADGTLLRKCKQLNGEIESSILLR